MRLSLDILGKSISLSLGEKSMLTDVQNPVGIDREDAEYNQGEEYNDALRAEKYDTMRRKDGQIRAVIRNTRLPILSAMYQIECENEEVKEFAERQFGLGRRPGNINWKGFLGNILSYLDKGFVVFEIVYGYNAKTGKEEIAHAGFRPQRSIYSFFFEEKTEGRVIGIRQYTQHGYTFIGEKDYDGGLIVDDLYTKPLGYEGGNMEDNGLMKIFHLAFEGEGSEPRGFPLLESVEQDYDDKQNMRKYLQMYARRLATGVPIIYYDREKTGQNELTAMRTTAANYADGKVKGITLPMGDAEFAIAGGEADGRFDHVSYLNYFDTQISKNYLSMLIELGTSATGSRAVGGSFLSNFFNAEKAIAEEIVEAVNNDLLCPLVAHNFSGDIECKMTVSDVIPKDLDTLLELIGGFVKDGVIPPLDEQQQEHVENLLELPENKNKPDLSMAGTE